MRFQASISYGSLRIAPCLHRGPLAVAHSGPAPRPRKPTSVVRPLLLPRSYDQASAVGGLLPSCEPSPAVAAFAAAHDPAGPGRAGVDDTEALTAAVAAPQTTLIFLDSLLVHWRIR